MDKNEIQLNSDKLISHVVSYILYSFLDKDLRPDDGLVKKVETYSHSKLYLVNKQYMH